MRLLQLHSDFIEYKPIEKEVAIAEDCEKKEKRVKEVVVLFVCVEKEDDDKIARKAVERLKSSLEQLKVRKILLYPYAHLSSNLARPSIALKVIKKMEEYAKDAGIETYRVPFGWCKRFSISIKGHPLAEQFSVISRSEGKEKEEIPEALKAEEKLESTWFVLQSDGELIPVDNFDFAKHETFGKLVDYEIMKIRAVQQVPPHVTLMRRLEIADYEPGSDLGNFRWYPKGVLIKSLLEQFVTQKVVEYGAMKVETPIMYDFQHPSLAEYLDRFPARQYVLRSGNKEFFLRFSACFGQFLILHDTQLSYRALPLKIYELTRYSFRREKSGELVGLRRLRAFTMPDCHAVCADLEQVKKEFFLRFILCREILEQGLGLDKGDYGMVLRFTKDFYKEHRDFVVSLGRLIDEPVLIEMWEKRFFYFILKWEFNFIDNLGKASALSTDQIDIENAERYGISYVDARGRKKSPLILHCSPSGAIERCVYALLEKAYREKQEKRVPMLPLWLSPTQVRIIPLSERYGEDAEKLAEEIEKHRVRVDVDDRSITMQKKVREAEREWINYVLVIGHKEIASNILLVRDREFGDIKKMRVHELIEEIKEKTIDKPFNPLPLSRNLSNRPRFCGWGS